MNKIKIVSLVAVVASVVATGFLWTSEKKQKPFFIKFYDKKFSVSEEVFKQFKVQKTEEDFKKKAGIKKEQKGVWSIADYIKDLMPEKHSDEDKKLFSQIVELLLDIASDQLDPKEVTQPSTLFMIVKIADKLGNDHVIRLCSGPLMRKTTRIKEIGPTHTFEGHTNDVLGVSLLPENQILSWSDDGTIRLWNLEGNQRGLVHIFEGHTDGVLGVFLLPENQILSWSKDNTIKLWNLEENQKGLVHTFEGHTSGVLGVILLPENQILSWSGDRTIRLWNLEGNQRGLVHIFEGHTNVVLGVSLLPENQILSWSVDGTIRLWNLEGNQRGLVHTFEGHTSEVSGVSLLPENQILSWSRDSTIKLWNLEGNQRGLVHTFEGHTSVVLGVILLPGEKFISKSGNREIRLWNLEGNQRGLVFEVFEDLIGDDALLPGEQLISRSYDQTIRMWDTGEIVYLFEKNILFLLSVKQFLSWSSYYQTIRLWDIGGGLVYIFKDAGEVLGVVLLPGEKNFLSWSKNGTIRLWNLDPFANFSFEQIEFCYDLFMRKDVLKVEKKGYNHGIFKSLPKFLQDEIKKKKLVELVDSDEEEEGEVELY